MQSCVTPAKSAATTKATMVVQIAVQVDADKTYSFRHDSEYESGVESTGRKSKLRFEKCNIILQCWRFSLTFCFMQNSVIAPLPSYMNVHHGEAQGLIPSHKHPNGCIVALTLAVRRGVGSTEIQGSLPMSGTLLLNGSSYFQCLKFDRF
jgi:hypothetical protein